MDRDDWRQVDAVVDGAHRTLGDGVVGLYLYGSAVLGGLCTFSDLDLLVVVDRPTTSDERRRLAAEVMSVSGSHGSSLGGRPVEVTVVTRAATQSGGRALEREFQYGERLRDDYEAGWVPEPVPDPDLAPLLATVLTASVALAGEPAQQVIEPIPHEQLVASMQAALPSLLADLGTDTANVLLTLARMWHTKDCRRIVRKDEAASWCLDRLPAHIRPPLEHARTFYLSGDHASFDRMPDPAGTAQHMSGQING